MSKVVIITDYYFEDRRGGGISSAVSNLYRNLNGDLNISLLSFRNENGKKNPVFYYASLIKVLFFEKNIILYLNGIFNFHGNIVPIVLTRFSRNKLIVSPRGMLKASALNKSRKKYLFLKVVRVLLKKSTIIHVTDKTEQKESDIFFSDFKHKAILDFPPRRIKEFPERIKHSGQVSFLYIGRIDELKNLYSVLAALKNLLSVLGNGDQKSSKNIKLTIIGQNSDSKYFDLCMDLIDELVVLSDITISYLEFVPHYDLNKFLLDHHVFVSLSKGENFGYTIAESLASAMPVIITSNSPFGKLYNFRIGSVISGEDLNKICNEFLFYYNMSKVDYSKLSKNIFENYTKIFRNSELISEYKKLFIL